MQQLQKENEKKLRDKRLLPAAKHNCITGMLELIMHDYPYNVVCLYVCAKIVMKIILLHNFIIFLVSSFL